MEIRQLEYFILVSEEKSFNKAANRAYVSQQALSKSVQNLEKELGVPLFVRSNLGVQLTDYGEILFKRATNILAQIKKLSDEMIEKKGHNDEVIAVGVAQGLASLFWDGLWGFQEKNPGVRITIIEAFDKTIELEVFNEKLDIGCLSAVGDTIKFEHYLFIKSKTSLAVSKDHFLAERDKVRLKDLSNETFVFGTEDMNLHGTFQKACRERGFIPNIRYQSPDLHFCKQMVRMNKGIFLFADNLLENLRDSGIKILEIEDDLEIHYSYLITKKNREKSQVIKSLLDYLINKYSYIQ